MFELNGATVSLWDVAVAMGCLALLGVVFTRRIRQAVLALTGWLMRLMLLAVVLAGIVWAVIPSSEPTWVAQTHQPLVESVAESSGWGPETVKPIVSLLIVCTVLVAGMVLLELLGLARTIGTQVTLLDRLAAEQRRTIDADVGPSGRRKLWRFLTK
jgi:hypothetical protein